MEEEWVEVVSFFSPGYVIEKFVYPCRGMTVIHKKS